MEKRAGIYNVYFPVQWGTPFGVRSEKIPNHECGLSSSFILEEIKAEVNEERLDIEAVEKG